MASILTDVTNTIQNDNMMFPYLKPSPITILALALVRAISISSD